MKDIVNFLFEVGILARTPRSGFHFLGTGEQSVAEHIARVIFVGYTLASLSDNINVTKVLKMCLFHDVAEARISDLNYIHQKYLEKNEKEAVEDLTKTLSFGKDMRDVIEEYEKRESKEAVLAKDADNIEWILSLKEQLDTGNAKAEAWISAAVKRLKTDVAKRLAQHILETDSDEWWFGNKESDWWVNRDKQKLSEERNG